MNRDLTAWVDECAARTEPATIHWCDGSEAENQNLIEAMLDDGTLHGLNPQRWPGCYLHRSNPNDVARMEDRTFICSALESDAGPTNNWMEPASARTAVGELFQGCMRRRTMYVVPYTMGPTGSAHSRVGVEITDSRYVAASMRIMTRMGSAALAQLDRDGSFVAGLHSIGNLDPAKRFVLHFPDDRAIWSYGSGYGGNALLGKKCFALRIASVMAREQQWMAEHMLILELEDPTGAKTWFAAAFPSACGKTNLAMLISPLEAEGYKVRTVGDDIAWMRIGADGRLWAVNPEAGFFGVAPGTNSHTNPNALTAASSNSIFTNVALTAGGDPWWEGLTETAPADLTDWTGIRPWKGTGPAAHPNSRFTAPARQCPSISPHWEDPSGVPISAIIFGGRRNKTVPLVLQSFSWEHGVLMGATMRSRTTAAATGKANVLRNDPMAMLPFCGYHMGDYFSHWLEMGRRIPHPPTIFQVNWFRQDSAGNNLWPGYGDNVRALIWMMERTQGKTNATETPVGWVPRHTSLHLEGLAISKAAIDDLLAVDSGDWREETAAAEQFLQRFGDRLPQELSSQLAAQKARLGVSLL